jgi:DNA-binding NarL/FixJ family response regulator
MPEMALAERLAQTYPEPDLTASLGRIANERQLVLVRHKAEPILTPFETQITRVTSLGVTVKQAAESLLVDPKIIHNKRQIIPEKLEVVNMAEAVNYQIEHGHLLYRRKAQPKIVESLNVRDRLYINLIAQGWTDAEIADRFEQSPKEINNYNQGLMKRAHAHKRPNLVRRGWEMGVIQPNNSSSPNL